MSKPLTQSYLNKKSLRVFEFRDSYVLYMFYRYEHYMSISHMALIVARVHVCKQVLLDVSDKEE